MADKNEEVKLITERLEAGIKELFSSGKYKEYLDTLSKFHNYSYRNCMLILMQKPDATLVAGFNSWRDNFGRNVNKGEKGIRILAYAPYKTTKEQEVLDKETGLPILDENGKAKIEDVQITIPAYKPVSVFDVSQTEGKELPQLGSELTGSVEDYDKFLDVLKEVSPVPIKFDTIDTGSHGFYSSADKSITVKEGMSQAQTVKTTIHEIAHAMLHDTDEDAKKDRNTKEVEAESVAYTVCQHFGIDSSDYSFAYVAGWSSSKELSELQSSLETIRDTASELITKISEKYLGIEKDKTLEQAEQQPESPQRSDSKIIGNVPYRFIKDKQYIKVPAANALKAEEFLSSHDIKYSGKVSEGSTTFTVPKSDANIFRKFVNGLTADNDNIEYKIYQLKSGDEYHGIRFESFEANKDKNLAVNDYELVYSGRWSEISGNTTEDKLNTVYDKFNSDLPSDFKGHSLSVSDVITVGDTAHYVDDMGFAQMPDFFKAKERAQDIPQEPVQSVQELPTVKITVSDKGIIGNTPYKDIPNKCYIKMSAEEAIKAAEKLEATGVIGYSGRIIGDKATLTIDSEDEPLFRALTITPEEIKQQTKQELSDMVHECKRVESDLKFEEMELKAGIRAYTRFSNENDTEQMKNALEVIKQSVRNMDDLERDWNELIPTFLDVSERFDNILQAEFRDALVKDMPQIIHSKLSAEEMTDLAANAFDAQVLNDIIIDIFSGEQSYSISGVAETSAASELEKFAKELHSKDKPLPELTSTMADYGAGVVFQLEDLSVALIKEELTEMVLQTAKDFARENKKNLSQKSNSQKLSLSERIGDIKKKSVQRSAEEKPNNKTKGVDLS